jgi:hypothetical protein
MKFARANLSIVHVGVFGRASRRRNQSVSNILLRSNSARPCRISRPCSELIAHWQLSLETGRIECRWLLDQSCPDDYLCAEFTKTKWQQRPPLKRTLTSRRSCKSLVSQSCH